MTVLSRCDAAVGNFRATAVDTQDATFDHEFRRVACKTGALAVDAKAYAALDSTVRAGCCSTEGFGLLPNAEIWHGVTRTWIRDDNHY